MEGYMALPGWGAAATGEEKEKRLGLEQNLLEDALWQTSSSPHLSVPS